MPWGRLPRYCCNNTAHNCVHARTDAVFTPAQYATWGGLCKGTDDKPGCGKALVPGKPFDVRLRWIGSVSLAATFIAVSGWALRTLVFPPPLAGIVFEADQSRVEDSAGQVVVSIRRTSALDARAALRALFVDGSAKAGEDYQAPGQTVVLEPGQVEARLSIPVLPDASLRKSERHFSVTLDNVLGQPRHVVVIAPKKLDVTAQIQLDQMVLAASRLGADIAGFVVKAETMEQLLSRVRDRDQEFAELRQQMRDASDNLVRAREAYLQAVRGLQTQPPQQVLATIDRLHADLKQRNFRQQSRVLPVLGRQYQELVKGQSADMDRWVKELGQTIERVLEPVGRPGPTA